MAYKVEVTDTVGGEANYCWVNRYVIDLPELASNRQIVTAAKKIAGWTNVKCDTEASGDDFTLRPRKLCQIMFINWVDPTDLEYELIKATMKLIDDLSGP